MRKKKFLAFAITVIAVVGFAIYDYQSNKLKEKEKQESSFLLGPDADQIAKIKIKTATEEIEVQKKPEGWWLVKPIDELADQKATQDFLDGIAAEKSVEAAIEKADIDLSVFGLDKPLGTLTVSNNLGEETVFSVGSLKNFEGDAFVRINQDNRILIASSTWFPKFEKRAFEFRDKRLMKFPNAGAEQILMERGKNSFRLVKKENQWIVSEHPEWNLDQNKVRETLSMLHQTEALEYIAEGNAKSHELQKWGLLQPRLKIQVQMKDGKIWKASFAAGSDKVHRVHTMEPNQVMKISPTASDQFFRMTADSFRDREEPFDFDKSQVRDIEIKLGKNSHVFKSNDEKGKDLIKQLKSLTVSEFKESPQTSLDNQILLKGENGEVFQFQWGGLQKVTIGGNQTQVFTAKTSLFPKTFTLMESEIASLKLDELTKREKTP